MLEAFGWGFLAASSLIVGCGVALVWPVGPRPLGLVMAFGSGVLISAVAFELVQEAWDTDGGRGSVAFGLFAGSLVFYAGDTLIDRAGGEHRKHSGGKQAEGAPLAIVLGTVPNGIPESIVLGLSLIGGAGVSVAYLIAVFISNIPEAFFVLDGPRAGGVGEGTRDRPVGAGRVRVGPVGALRLRRVRQCLGRRPGVRARLRRRRDPHDAGRHDDPGGLRARRQLVGVVTTFGFAVAFGLSAFT